MKTNQHGWFCGKKVSTLQLSACALLLASCSLPQAQPDPTRFYLLAMPERAAPEAALKTASVCLRPVELANYLKAKPMVVRRGTNEIEFREYARWGEPLELGVSRVLREALLERGAARVVLTSGLRASEADCPNELTVRMLACEGGADGAVLFHAVWEISTTGANPAIASRGDFRATGLKWDGKNESSLAAALSQAVVALGGEITTGMANAAR